MITDEEEEVVVGFKPAAPPDIKSFSLDLPRVSSATLVSVEGTSGDVGHKLKSRSLNEDLYSSDDNCIFIIY